MRRAAILLLVSLMPLARADDTYDEQRAALRDESLAALPPIDPQAKAAYAQALANERAARELLDRVTKRLAGLETARRLVAHARDQWIPKAEKNGSSGKFMSNAARLVRPDFSDLAPPRRGRFEQPGVARHELPRVFCPWDSTLKGLSPGSMSQSLSSVFLHIVFSTKGRFPFLADREARQQLPSFLGGIARRMECPPVLVGGVSDHVHVLPRMSRTVSQADLVKELKRGSNLWIQERFPHIEKFAWQAGCGVFPVSASNLETVRHYIAEQDRHHARLSFQDEFRAFLAKRLPRGGSCLATPC